MANWDWLYMSLDTAIFLIFPRQVQRWLRQHYFVGFSNEWVGLWHAHR
jgi:hypothetical protein